MARWPNELAIVLLVAFPSPDILGAIGPSHGSSAFPLVELPLAPILCHRRLVALVRQVLGMTSAVAQ